MQYKLVNVYGVRDEAFTAELIVPFPEDMPGAGVVGVFEENADGNVMPGVSVYTVYEEETEDTGRVIERHPLAESEELVYTPQLV